MAKQPKTAIEQRARASARISDARVMRRGRPTTAFLHSKKWKRIRNILLLILAFELVLFSLNFRMGAFEFIPEQAFANLKAMLQIPFRSLFDKDFDADALRESLPYYDETVSRLKLSLIAFFSGFIICVGGAMFQTIFRNPIASPNMLGVSTGVSFGNVLFVLAYQLEAYSHLTMRYVYCYAAAIVLVLIAFGAGRLSGKRLGQFSVEGTIIAGMMITQLGGVIMQYYQLRLQADETGLLEMYTELANGDVLYTDKSSMIVFSVCTALTILPMIFLHYRFNSVAFDDMEMKAMGVNNSVLRGLGLVLGSMMATMALIHCGDVGFLCMVIPFMCRQRAQTEFGEVAYLSGMLGGIVSLAVRIILIMVGDSGMAIPASVITTLIMLPLFIFTLIRRGSAFQ